MVAIHRTAFPDSALTAFGDEVVRRYYAWLLDGPHDASLMGAWIDSRLVGFCAAGIFRGAMNGFLRLNRRFLASRVLLRPTLLASPLIRSRVRSALSITVRFSRLAQRRTPPAQPSFGVLAIATSRDVRGRGAGRALMLEAEARARTGGHRRMVLTVHPSNARAVAFYEQLHWVRTIGSDGTWSGAMHRDL
ncbi:MAG: GNAT family N-acetyltransferase [Kofleriaceae bacterium]|nr:GNAT family N-acetyltransferase [Kofleriaceae bacterium]